MRSNRPTTCLLIVAALVLTACGSSKQTQQKDFFTSGNREADQRAEQRIVQTAQIRGESPASKSTSKKSLYERLGGDAGIKAIVDDFLPRALEDPRINWTRKGTTRGGFLGMGKKSAEWSPTDNHVATLKAHMIEFITLASGGPANYQGRDMRSVHQGMGIDNAEFDAAVGDLKASLDRLGIATAEQKELIAIFESTRPEIAEKR